MQLWKGWMLMRSSLKALFGHPVRVGGTSRVRSGSPVAYLLRAEPSFAKSVSAAQVLAKRHLPLRAAKAVVERLLEKEDVTIEIPKVENARLFESELEELGINAIRREVIEEINTGHARPGQEAVMATGRAIPEPFETTGEWFLPETPERRIAGTLTYKPDRIFLELSEPFRALRGAVHVGDTERYSLIHGVTREGEAMTLVNAQRTRMTFNFGSGGMRQPEQLFSVLLIAGANVPANFAYPELTFRIPGLQVWLSRRIIEESSEKDERTGRATRTYRVLALADEVTRVPAINASLAWGVSCQSKADPFASIVVATAGWVTIRPDEPQVLDWYFEQLIKLITLLTFLAGGPMAPDLIQAPIGNSHHNASILVVRPGERYWTGTSLLDFFIPKGAMGTSLETVVSQWFERYAKVQVPSQLAMSIMTSDNLWPHVEFLSLAQALEGFHRGLFDGTYMTPADYEEVSKALRDAIPQTVAPDHKDALRTRVRYGNEFSLRKRLNELAEMLSPAIRTLIFGPDGRVPQRWIDTRNYYSHWDQELRANILDGQNMIYAIPRIRHFLRALYLQLAGIPEQALQQALSNTSGESQYLAQINAIERRSRDPSDTSGVIMTVVEQEASPRHSDPLVPK